jgi:hypothetical protein
MNLPDEIVQAIVADLVNRIFLDEAWEAISPDVRFSIMSDWRTLVRDKILEAIKDILPEE